MALLIPSATIPRRLPSVVYEDILKGRFATAWYLGSRYAWSNLDLLHHLQDIIDLDP